MKKGFTLIELLGVIILLGVIALIVFPIVDNALKSSNAKALEQTINNIEAAALQYSTDNFLDYENGYQALDLSVLKESGVLKDEQILNPETDDPLTGCVVYVWSDSSKQFIFVYSDECILPAEDSCFDFDEQSRTITSYLCSSTVSDVIIPGVIGGVPVENIADDAFYDMDLTSVYFNYLRNLKQIGKRAFSMNALTYIDISKLKSIESIDETAFLCNQVRESNFIGKYGYDYDYFNPVPC